MHASFSDNGFGWPALFPRPAFFVFVWDLALVVLGDVWAKDGREWVWSHVSFNGYLALAAD